MVAESWFGNLWKVSKKIRSETQKPEKIGILSFEVATLMSKVVHLWRNLGDDQVIRLREEIMNSVGIRKLVSDDDEYVVGLVCAEIIENLSFVVKSVGRIGNKCVDPVLQRFENVFEDLMRNDVDLYAWEFSWKKMDRKIKKFEKYVRMVAHLYHEMEALGEISKVQASGDSKSADRLEYQKKVLWQRQEVKNLQETSLWNKTYDYVVLLLARSIVTLFKRINHVFGIHQTAGGDVSPDFKIAYTDHLPRSRSISGLRQMSVHPADNNVGRFSSGPLGRSSAKSGPLFARSSGPLGRFTTKSGPLARTQDYSSNLGKPPRLKTKRFTPGGPFKGCIMGGNKSPVLESFAPVNSDYLNSDSVYSGSLGVIKGPNAETQAHWNLVHASLVHYKPKTRLLDAPPSTLGAAALAIHYANVIIRIEELMESTHLIDSEARDNLYSMLSTSIKTALRARLKSYVRNLASSYYDTDLAAEWSEALARIVEWLAPLAHNMMRWQSERSFQQQHLASRTTVLLVQTLFFANQAKTEAAITELLVGLNYIWRFNKELNEKALQECTSSIEFDDSLHSS